VIEAVRHPDSPAKYKVTGKDDVLAAECDDERTLRRPWTYSRYLGESRDQLVVCQRRQHVRVQSPVAHARCELTKRADLPPGQPGVAKLCWIGAQYVIS
jgi:hypothetical protein